MKSFYLGWKFRELWLRNLVEHVGDLGVPQSVLFVPHLDGVIRKPKFPGGLFPFLFSVHAIPSAFGSLFCQAKSLPGLKQQKGRHL